ncbi:VOC family protein [Facklamia miroungae]|uniref:Glyoxalase family protein n=1 Tax=Facklamia miroungae TaxID=120956 RepID=A0A1G7QIL9_9LACT|nr:VOC family protein [Facklamia miroungae]NKZ28937.1 ring-cleaving dioxygenase [Facklamia miroungae]SDF97769.1 glyoxalase family protein [Facklamia miroungae]
MVDKIQSIHHVSAIVGNVQENYDFYSQVLNLKLVKQTVNFDDPSVYHLYFANANVDNGTIMTFFPWESNKKGTKGGGQVGRIGFAIPNGSLEHWQSRLDKFNINYQTSNMFGATTLEFADPHDLDIALVESDIAADNMEILGFYGLVLISIHPQGTLDLLTREMGAKLVEETDNYLHIALSGPEKHRLLLTKKAQPLGRFGISTVHHVAWSVDQLKDLKDWHQQLKEAHYHLTPVKDRKYFKSIYLREKGGIIFEFATKEPGFLVDETFEALGRILKLPAQFEKKRSQIVSTLPSFKVR